MQRIRIRRHLALLAVLAGLGLLAAACGEDEAGEAGQDTLDEATEDDPVEITMYYPIAVGGPLEDVVDGLVADFEAEHPEIQVNPVYSGNYDDTIVQAQSAIDAGDVPATTVLLSTDMFSLIDDDLIVPFDELVTDEDEEEWLDSFYDEFMLNSRDGEGTTWGIPFQRSTIVQYYNKDAFEEAGLDPEQPPGTWDELVDMSAQVQEGSDVEWGVQMPSSGFPYWLFQTFTTQMGVEIVNDEGNEVYYDQPEVVEALEFWHSLNDEHGVHPPGVVDWGTTPEDFLQEETAIIWTTTGNLASIRDDAPFDFGVAPMPENVEPGSPTGGGNFYIFEGAPEEEQRAAFQLIRFLTQPEQAAEWSIETGYVAPSPEAWETDQMQEYVEDFPEAEVARDQLGDTVRELSTYQRGEVYDIVNDGLQAAVTGEQSPEEALADIDERANEVLEPYR
ncbi:ABC transporter substrate-binding protein [Egibacter rhizosphaerae]|uniref:ABC transporter substrate-binding protein n=1 Tax=Egibacter rhizosphaerae TaxID=1670831 RepID=A0A411YC45_9ACTN|nr:ABC transporter substrate-binding protein [Egibacter rhizosphaerae]QBI18758.1 ABC transporter substrate-binding protein [Egibacter rhizosphaerae]